MLNKSKIRKFKKFLNDKDIFFDDITFELLQNYKSFLEKENLKSANRYLLYIRQIYNHAIENDCFFPKSNPFKKSLFPKKINSTTTNRNLTKEQTIQLFNLSYSTRWNKKYIDVALDFWKFCFLMRGINFIEMALMKKEDVQTDYFTFTREKLKTRTNKTQKIKIFPEARAIINKYIDDKSEFVFPLLENGFNKDLNVRDYRFYKDKMSVVNSNLRKIGKDLNISFNLTTMSARYTFINLAKLNQVPFLYLQELIGHKNLTTTDIYLDVFPQSKIDEYHRQIIDLILKN